MGVVIWDPSYEDPEDLLRAADTAMYRAKEDGRGCHRIFDEDMHKSLLRTLKAENDLRASLRQREFSLAYQPIVDLKTGSIRSLEALVRWHHPERGVVFPREFLAIAENSGLIVALGEMCLEEVCSQISRWQSRPAPRRDLPVELQSVAPAADRTRLRVERRRPLGGMAHPRDRSESSRSPRARSSATPPKPGG